MISFDLHNPMQWLDDLLALTQLEPKHKTELLNLYGHNTRSYHGLFHIAFLWHCHVRLRHLLIRHSLGAIPKDTLNHVDRIMATLIACHDVIQAPFQPHGFSEGQSAVWWRHCAMEDRSETDPMLCQGFDSKDVEWIATAIEASSDHTADRPMLTFDDILLQWFLGIDLIPLAAPDKIFDMNSLMIRGEWSHLPQKTFDKNRKKFLKKLGSVPVIFRHPELHALFEAPARANFRRALSA